MKHDTYTNIMYTSIDSDLQHGIHIDLYSRVMWTIARQPAFNYPEEDVDPADELRPTEAAE